MRPLPWGPSTQAASSTSGIPSPPRTIFPNFFPNTFRLSGASSSRRRVKLPPLIYFWEPLIGFQGIHAPIGGAGQQDFDKRETDSFNLHLECLADRFLGLHQIGWSIDRDSSHEGSSLQGGQHLRHSNRGPRRDDPLLSAGYF